MIADLKPYPSYKDSGVPWLGQIPDHWTLPRLKTVLKERIEKGYPFEPLLAATQTKGVIRKEQYENRTVLALKDLHLLKLVRRGDFVISLRSFQGGIEFAREQGIISPAYTVLYPINSDTHGYLAKLFKSKPYIENLTLHVTGIRQGQNIDYTKLARSVASLPPPPEQAAIVRYLDYVDRDIRKYIRAKQKLIKLLEEQKQAIIHQAVTRGLNPDVPMKPSGVEWLGDVPAHWDVKRLKFISRISGRIGFRGYTTDDLVDSGEGALTLGATHIRRNGEMDFSKPVYISWEKYYESPEIMVQKNDILIVQRGSTCGKIGYVRNVIGKATINPSLVLITDIIGTAEFMFLALTCSTARTYFNSILSSTAIPMLSQYQIGNVPLLYPPVHEQKSIVSFVKESTKDFEVTKTNLQNEISVLKEYRTRLIADVVTGKVDVRDIAARLPDADESDILEEAVPDDEVVDTEEAELSAEDTDADD